MLSLPQVLDVTFFRSARHGGQKPLTAENAKNCREDAGIDIAECNDNCTGKGCGIYQVGAAQLPGVTEPVRQNQAAFTVKP